VTSVSELLGIEQKIEAAVKAALDERGITITTIGDTVKAAVDSYAADVYSTMKELEMYKYKFIELETKVSNLQSFVKFQSSEKYDRTDGGG